MSPRQHIILFIVTLIGCWVAVFIIQPERVYIPIAWGLYGVLFYGILTIRLWLKLSKRLINDHKEELKKWKIRFTANRFKKTIDMITLIKKRKQLATLSSSIQELFHSFQVFASLYLIGFIMFGALGIAVVLLAD